MISTFTNNNHFTPEYQHTSDVLKKYYLSQKWKPLSYSVPIDETSYTSDNLLVRTTLRQSFLPVGKLLDVNENVFEPTRSPMRKNASLRPTQENKYDPYTSQVSPTYLEPDDKQCLEKLTKEESSIEDSDVIIDGIIEHHELNCIGGLVEDQIDPNATVHAEKENSIGFEETLGSHYSHAEVMEIENILEDLVAYEPDLIIPDDRTESSCAFNVKKRSKSPTLCTKLPDLVEKTYECPSEHRGCISMQDVYIKEEICHQNLEANLKNESSDPGNEQYEQPTWFSNDIPYVWEERSHQSEEESNQFFPTLLCNPWEAQNRPSYQYDQSIPQNYHLQTQLNRQMTTVTPCMECIITNTLSLGEELKDSLEIMYGNDLLIECPLSEASKHDNQVISNEQPVKQKYLTTSESQAHFVEPYTRTNNPTLEVPSQNTAYRSQYTSTRTPENGDLTCTEPPARFQTISITIPDNVASDVINPTYKSLNSTCKSSITAGPYSEEILNAAKESYIKGKRHIFLSRNRDPNYPLSSLKQKLEHDWSKLPASEKLIYVSQVCRTPNQFDLAARDNIFVCSKTPSLDNNSATDVLNSDSTSINSNPNFNSSNSKFSNKTSTVFSTNTTSSSNSIFSTKTVIGSSTNISIKSNNKFITNTANRSVRNKVPTLLLFSTNTSNTANKCNNKFSTNAANKSHINLSTNAAIKMNTNFSSHTANSTNFSTISANSSKAIYSTKTYNSSNATNNMHTTNSSETNLSNNFANSSGQTNYNINIDNNEDKRTLTPRPMAKKKRYRRTKSEMQAWRAAKLTLSKQELTNNKFINAQDKL